MQESYPNRLLDENAALPAEEAIMNRFRAIVTGAEVDIPLRHEGTTRSLEEVALPALSAPVQDEPAEVEEPMEDEAPASNDAELEAEAEAPVDEPVDDWGDETSDDDLGDGLEAAGFGDEDDEAAGFGDESEEPDESDDSEGEINWGD